LTGLDRLEEPPSLVALRQAVSDRLPQVDLPELLLEIDGEWTKHGGVRRFSGPC